MDRTVGFRQPQVNTNQRTTLSSTSKTFFMLNIFQVFVTGGIQTAMMVLGDFSAISDEGMGPGRRVYMALFAGAVIYSCFLCLFAVKNENFLEIFAFVIQDFGYVIYSLIQVYHINFKSYQNVKFHTPRSLAILSVVNSVSLVLMNAVFAYLAFKLFKEYGWKIYKRVRFNLKLRAAFHLYELVVCLIKMTVLFIAMFFLCMNLTVLRDLKSHPVFAISLAVIPFITILFILQVIAIRKENKMVMFFVICILIAMIGGLTYEIYAISKFKCIGCQTLKEVIDIPEELIMHLQYLGAVALFFTFLLTVVTLRAVRNFGIGLRHHFKNRTMNSTVLILGLSREILSSILSHSTSGSSQILDSLPDINKEGTPDVKRKRSSTIETNVNISHTDIIETVSNNNITNGFTYDSSNMSSSVEEDMFDESYVNRTNEVVNKKTLEETKSSTIPARLPKEQRHSVLERLSKQASERLNQLYGRNNSRESFLKDVTCSCCFLKRRQSDSSTINLSMNNISRIDGERNPSYKNDNITDEYEDTAMKTECTEINTLNETGNTPEELTTFQFPNKNFRRFSLSNEVIFEETSESSDTEDSNSDVFSSAQAFHLSMKRSVSGELPSRRSSSDLSYSRKHSGSSLISTKSSNSDDVFLPKTSKLPTVLENQCISDENSIV